jgi:plasmid segregation protein ParM
MPVRAIDVGCGNVKYCQGETEGRFLCGHFPFIASLFTGLDRGAGVMSRRDLVEVESGSSRYLVGRDSIDTLSVRDDRGPDPAGRLYRHAAASDPAAEKKRRP